MLRDLDQEERMLLLKLVCGFAWADCVIKPQERAHVERLVKRLGLSEEEHRHVEEWLNHAAPEVDPNLIPRRHRELFLKAALDTIKSDGVVAPEEAESYELLRQLLT